MYYEATYRVGAGDVDPFNQCRPSSVQDFLQEAATEAAVRLNVSREKMVEKYNAFWMLARIWYRLDKPLFWNDELRVRTWHRGGRGASMYRDFDLFRGGEPIGEAVSVWVLADVESHKLLCLGDIEEFQATGGGELCKSMLLPKLRIPAVLEPAMERPLHYSDADVNGHVNNTRYADFACDALHMQRLGAGRFVSALQIGFLKECRPGETICLSAGHQGDVWYVQGDGAEGKTRFDAAVTLSPLDNPGNGA